MTPAHDPNDFEIGQRHQLPAPVIMNPAAEMEAGDAAAGRVPRDLAGLGRFDARTRIVDMLRATGSLERVQEHVHAVRHCYRCATVVEPRLSDQWFVRMAPLAAPALAALRSGEIRIVPDRWVAVYEHWMENIRDWNISRQLWWGHRIPVWYCDACGWEGTSRDDLSECPACHGVLRQDEDVLDTWFSSWLWPLSTLGWPDETADMRAFYPGDVLVSGPDILFFWVARMIMAGLHFDGRPPFHTVFLHGIVRDLQRRKMSKSLGNGIDPMDVVARYGADALRYTLIAGMGLGTDLLLDPDSLERSFAPGRNFVTKLWNMGRFLLTNLGATADDGDDLAQLEAGPLTRADHWILTRLDAAIAASDAALGSPRPGPDGRWADAQRDAGMRLSEYVEAARAFVWGDFADWYIEHCKGRLASDWDRHDTLTARAVLVYVFDMALRLLHPVVPYVTEALWQRLPSRPDESVLARAAWPTRAEGRDATWPVRDEAAREYDRVREAVSALRQIRTDYGIGERVIVDAIIEPASADESVFTDEAAAIGRLTWSRVRVGRATPPDHAAATAVLSDGSTVAVPLAGVIDLAQECKRLQAELGPLESQLTKLRERLANPGFTTRAPAQVVEARAHQGTGMVRARRPVARACARRVPRVSRPHPGPLSIECPPQVPRPCVRSRRAPRWLAIVCATVAAACAGNLPPPGGPPRHNPPLVLFFVPETNAVNVRAHEASIQFDEVISERPQGAPDLAGLFLISPWDGDPHVELAP